MTEPTPTIRLRTGIEEAEPTVAIVYGILERWWTLKPGALFEFAMMCRDPNFQPMAVTVEALKADGLIDVTPDGKVRIDASTRNVVLAAVGGEGANMALRSPLAPKED